MIFALTVHLAPRGLLSALLNRNPRLGGPVAAERESARSRAPQPTPAGRVLWLRQPFRQVAKARGGLQTYLTYKSRGRRVWAPRTEEQAAGSVEAGVPGWGMCTGN